MSRGTTTAQPPAPAERSRMIARPGRLLAVAILICALIAAALIIPSWLPLWPRSLRRAITEVFLGAILVVYSVLLLSALLGTPLLAWLWKRSRSKREIRRGLERCLERGDQSVRQIADEPDRVG